MSSAITVFRDLLPFFGTVVLYFGVLIPYDQPSALAVILKCLPIISLVLFVSRHGEANGEGFKHSRRIATGLLCCCVGDALLLWNHFELGMLAFSVGHLNYIAAFGYKPLKLPIGVGTFAIGLYVTNYVYSGLHGILVIAVPIYIELICVVVWRATARVGFQNSSYTWSSLCCCAGSILFAISDLLIAIDKFCHPLANTQILVMSTYYAAQLGISLLVVGCSS
ncbi:lysoplasmalogenase TMEM86A [Cylas formicarius]|uniref:lysoplasmalogenase TMEM86A n=1 Tax=Cylas formicarius TaxID=197179 RepID=UPI0029587EB0|nr:lysoplasmalogenase TMEM86A [Cylas formicarius]